MYFQPSLGFPTPAGASSSLSHALELRPTVTTLKLSTEPKELVLLLPLLVFVFLLLCTFHTIAVCSSVSHPHDPRADAVSFSAYDSNIACLTQQMGTSCGLKLCCWVREPVLPAWLSTVCLRGGRIYAGVKESGRRNVGGRQDRQSPIWQVVTEARGSGFKGWSPWSPLQPPTLALLAGALLERL